jgi:integrase|tara:strand:- start:2776 stop:4083 length:1308 start_codon:yes stop_codon:yes gene_type:complete
MGKLTVREIESAKAKEKPYKLMDGCGLQLRIAPNGIKTWLVRYMIDGVERQYRLPKPYRDISGDGYASLADAREESAKIRSLARSSIDYQLQLEQKRNDEKLEEEKARQEEVKKTADSYTVSMMFKTWVKTSARKDSGAELKRSFTKDVLPFIGDVAVKDITRVMVVKLLDKVVERGSRISARNLLGDLRQMFGYAIVRDLLEHDPTSRLKRDDFGRKVERDRILSDEEIKLLPSKLAEARMAESSVAALWVMLSTCCRVGEVSKAEWADVNLEAKTWRIPPDNSKNAKEHTIILSEFAVRQFEILKTLSDESPWVLPARWTDKHVYVKSITKQVGDRQRGDKEPMSCRSVNTTALMLTGGKWTPHDLRRTGATTMGDLGIRPDVIEKCLNHKEQNALKRIYQRQVLKAEQEEAWRLLGERIELLLNDSVNNIIA